MLQTECLVLNRHYQPVHITSVRRALVMLYGGVARAMDRQYQLFDFHRWSQLTAELHDDTVGGVNRRILVPRVVVLQVYARLPVGKVRFSRHNIFQRDGDTCQYCGHHYPRRLLNLDHIIPRSRGGRTNWENIATSCIDCNLQKGGRTPAEAGMHLHRQPKQPQWADLRDHPHWPVRYREWLPFLNAIDASYWNTELDSD